MRLTVPSVHKPKTRRKITNTPAIDENIRLAYCIFWLLVLVYLVCMQVHTLVEGKLYGLYPYITYLEWWLLFPPFIACVYITSLLTPDRLSIRKCTKATALGLGPLFIVVLLVLVDITVGVPHALHPLFGAESPIPRNLFQF